MATYIARTAENIQADIQRGWSSWNFGQEGFKGTKAELEAKKEACIENEKPFYISGFELWGNDIINANIQELYAGYWVIVDDRKYGICGSSLESENLEDAIAESKTADYSGDGVFFDPSEYTLVHSENGIHIFEEIEL